MQAASTRRAVQTMISFDPISQASFIPIFVRLTVCMHGPLSGGSADFINARLSMPLWCHSGAAINKVELSIISSIMKDYGI